MARVPGHGGARRRGGLLDWATPLVRVAADLAEAGHHGLVRLDDVGASRHDVLGEAFAPAATATLLSLIHI
eukprot:4698503-Heterocapsa_arctica.AAC.1